MKTGPKRNKTEIARDRLAVAERYIKGETQCVIAESMGLTRQQISYDIDKMMQAWTREAVLEIDQAKGRELAKLNKLEWTFWEAWEHSKLPGKRTHTRKVDANRPLSEAGIIEEARDGNPAFLNGVLACIDRRCKILGLDAPLKIDLKAEAERIAREYDLTPAEAVLLLPEAREVMKEGANG